MCREYEGTGLGLSIVKSLVESHGGVIRVASSVKPDDHGTKFTIWLPTERRDAVAPMPGNSADSMAAKQPGAIAGLCMRVCINITGFCMLVCIYIAGLCMLVCIHIAGLCMLVCIYMRKTCTSMVAKQGALTAVAYMGV
jgi:hypothetical protein